MNSFTYSPALVLLPVVLLIGLISTSELEAQRTGPDYTRIARPELSEEKKPRFDPEKFRWEKFVTGGVRDFSTGLFLNSNTIEETPNNQTPQNESSIAVSPIDPSFLIASAVDSRPGAWVYISRDGGASWTNQGFGVVNDNWQSGNDPSVGFDAEGNAFLMYGAFPRPFSGESGVYIARSLDTGKSWEPHIRVIEHKGAMTADSAFEDKYYIEIDRSDDSPYKGWVYTPWKRVTDRDSATEIVFTRSTDGGDSWSEPIGVSPRKPGTSTHITFGQSFPLVKCGPLGEIYAVWNDGPARSIGFAKSTDGGTTWTDPSYPVSGYTYLGTDRFLTSIRQVIDTIDPGTVNQRFDTTMVTDTTDKYHVLKNTFRAETYPTIAVDVTTGDRRGNIYLCWSADTYPSIYFIRSEDGGETWSAPVIVQSDTTNDQWWPWISLDETNGDIAVMYSDSRNDPDNILIDTYVSYSSDGGVTWIDRKATDAMSDFRDNPFVDQVFAGDYSGNAFHDGIVYPSFLDTRDDNDVYTAVVDIRAPLPVENLQVESRFDELTEATLTWTDPPLSTTFALPLDEYVVQISRDGDSIATVARGTERLVDPGRTIDVTYEYDVTVVAGEKKSVVRSVEFEAGAARLPSAPVVLSAVEYAPTVSLNVLASGVRADSITPLGNLAAIRVYRDGEFLREVSVTPADTGSVTSVEDTPQKGYYRYQFSSVDADGNESALSEGTTLYAGDLGFYSLDEDRAYRLLLEGAWGFTTEISFSGTLSLTDSPDRNYRPRESTSAQLFPVQYEGEAILRFHHIAMVKPGDSAIVELSHDSGTTWTLLKTYDQTAHAPWEDGELGSDDWVSEEIELGESEGVAIVRFRLWTSTLGNDKGWFIDDAQIVASSSSVHRMDRSVGRLSVAVRPNPSKTLPVLYLRSAQVEEVTVSLYDLLGRPVFKGIETVTSGPGIQVRLSEHSAELPAGTYTWVVTTERDVLSGRIYLIP